MTSTISGIHWQIWLMSLSDMVDILALKLKDLSSRSPSNAAQSSLLSYRDLLEYWSKVEYYTFRIANNKCVDQTAQVHRLGCTFVVRWQQVSFSRVEVHI